MTTRTRRYVLAATVALGTSLPATAWAASGGEHGFPWVHLAATFVNFAIFLAILWKFALPAIQRGLNTRRELLMANLTEAKRLREEAEERLAQYDAKIKGLEQERQELLDEYSRQGEREKERIIEDAHRQVAKMRADAERLIEQELKRAVANLERRAVDEAVEIAKRMVAERLEQPAAQSKLVDRYVTQLSAVDSIQQAS